jgi:hypothetical protein
MSAAYIFSGRITVVSWCIGSRVWSTTNVLRTIITCTNLITQINMNIRDMNDLDWGFSTGNWTNGIWFSAHRYSVSCDVGPLAKPEDCEAEEL